MPRQHGTVDDRAESAWAAVAGDTGPLSMDALLKYGAAEGMA